MYLTDYMAICFISYFYKLMLFCSPCVFHMICTQICSALLLLRLYDGYLKYQWDLSTHIRQSRLPETGVKE